jgi:fumarate hydratase, class II
MTDYRVEIDSMGKVKVPSSAYYSAHTQRALENFPISGRRMPREFIRAMGIIKYAAAEANMSLGLLDEGIGPAIVAEDVLSDIDIGHAVEVGGGRMAKQSQVKGFVDSEALCAFL